MAEADSTKGLFPKAKGSSGGKPPGKSCTGSGEGDSDIPSRQVRGFWDHYKKVLKESFERMSPAQQKDLLLKLAIILVASSIFIIFCLHWILK